MKIGIVFGALLLVSSAVVRAEDEGSGANFGVQAGATFAGASTDTAGQGYGRITGYSAGLALEAPVVLGVLYLQPELNFVQKGNTWAVTGGEYTSRLNYIELPVQLKAKLDTGSLHPFIMAGPRIGFLAGASGATTVAGANPFGSDAYKRFEIGFNVAAGAGFAMSDSSELTLMARVGRGLTNIASNSAGIPARPDTRNNTVEILAGYLF